MRRCVGNGDSALDEYLHPTGKRSAVKVARSVWSGGKAVKPYLSLPFLVGWLGMALGETSASKN